MILPIDNFLADFFGVFVTEWRVAEDALKHYDSDTPNVYSMIVAVLGQNFRSDIIRSSYLRKVPFSIEL